MLVLSRKPGQKVIAKAKAERSAAVNALVEKYKKQNPQLADELHHALNEEKEFEMVVMVTQVTRNKVRLGFQAGSNVTILRDELLEGEEGEAVAAQS